MHHGPDFPTDPPAAPADAGEPRLIDSLGRSHHSLRISVTDRCNIRCFYCMPAENVQFLPKTEILSFEEIHRLVSLLAGVGIRNLRLTGGEPLVRKDLPDLVRLLARVPGIEDIALTTNGMLLQPQAMELRAAGLRRVNISLDTLHEATFEKISRRQGLDRVIAGIDAATAAGFDEVRLNALAIRGVVEQEAVSLVEFASARQLTMRFIEFMPLDADRRWDSQQVLSGDELLRMLEQHFGPAKPLGRQTAAQPASDYGFAGGQRVGLIRPVTAPFCGACDRLRLTAEGGLRNCLFSQQQWSLREPLRCGGSDQEILRLVRSCVAAKQPGHLIDQPGFEQPDRAMYQIGG
ncbi:GTP 3',8-cyclase MoaA [Roseimaritima ulvae]|uniref:GTP 3',8-cyclase n=1 Tax=Roseimaritima ulvae TaxID=980254 RepID=A0A5B9QI10_9BACT|nr:GTP 3',8-cyclase MoaA [Roseimaritima ulvae]QEG38494.1 Cyclic pyranopterin monophosphate synthase [Roseimaritima ulvae]